MTPLSYVLAGASCVPIVGPYVNLYNIWKLTEELLQNPVVSSLENSRDQLTGIRIAFAALSGNDAQLEEVDLELQERIETHTNKYIPLYQKGQVYTICGIVGDVLSIALLVSLTALEILAAPHTVIISGCFVVQAALLSYGLYRLNEKIDNLQNP
jgi:hypothetical protein